MIILVSILVFVADYSDKSCRADGETVVIAVVDFGSETKDKVCPSIVL